MQRSIPFVTHILAVAIAGAAIGVSGRPAAAQCVSGWLPASANSNMGGTVIALRSWDPDGAGSGAPVLAALGTFTMAGTTAANKIATWDGTNWSTFPGTGLVFSGTSGGLATLSSNNNLFCVGTGMTSADGVSTKGIAGWDGSGWFGLSTSSITALVAVAAVSADTIAVTGVFTSINGVPANRVATWNTTTGWAALDDGTSNGISSTGSAVLGLSNGNIIVGGAADFTGVSGGSGAGPLQINRVARWDGAWHTMGSGFTTTDSVAHPPGLVRCLLEMPDGDVIAGGSFVFSGATALNKIARWDHITNTWQPLGAGINNDTGFNHDVYALALMPNGDVVVGGDFTTAGGTARNFIARWHPATSTWSSLGAGDVGVGGPVRSLAVLPNGTLAVGGDFLTAGGNPAQRFAIWSEQSAVAITTQPVSQTVDVDASADFILDATGSGPLTYQWQQQDLLDLPNFVDIADGPVLDPFNNVFCTATGTTTNHLTLTNFTGVAQVFRCVVSNPCSHADSSEVTLTFTEACPADFNGDDAVSVQDIFDFLAAYFSNDPSADVNASEDVTVQDIFDYLAFYFAGCP